MTSDDLPDELLEAVRDLEGVEDRLHDENHPLADDVSDVRSRINDCLINEVLGVFD
jgi:hypothetical protein